jgi:hypothetical protein
MDVGPCHHGMARPGALDGGDGLQIRKVATNTPNTSSRTFDKGGRPAWGLGEGAKTSHRKKKTSYEMLHRASDLWTW